MSSNHQKIKPGGALFHQVNVLTYAKLLVSWVCKENPSAKIKTPDWRFWILSDNSKVSQKFKSQFKKQAYFFFVFVFVALVEFSVLCTYVINTFSFKKFHRQNQWEKKLCGLGWANRDAMRQCRRCWPWDEFVYQQEQYLLHLSWAPLHPGRLPFEGRDSSHGDSNQ